MLSAGVLFLDWKRCEVVSSLDKLDGICGGMEVTVAETRGMDGMYPLKGASVLGVTVCISSV